MMTTRFIMLLALVGGGYTEKLAPVPVIAPTSTSQPAEAALPLEPIVLKLDMARDMVQSLLLSIHAEDTGEGMQVEPAPAPKGWMWYVETPRLSIETEYKGDFLTTLNIWDWSDRTLTRYHHLMEYEEVSELTIHARNGTYQAVVIKVHNKRY